jgi:hypothetical protein
MKRAMLLLLAFAGLTVSMYAEGMQTGELPTNEMIKQNREIVKLASEEITKTLPQKVDKYTTLLRVEGQDTTLVYVFEINTGAKSDETVRNEDRTRMQEAVTSGICRSSKRFLDAEIDIAYLYKSAASKEKLFQFNVSKDDCPQSVK